MLLLKVQFDNSCDLSITCLYGNLQLFLHLGKKLQKVIQNDTKKSQGLRPHLPPIRFNRKQK